MGDGCGGTCQSIGFTIINRRWGYRGIDTDFKYRPHQLRHSLGYNVERNTPIKISTTTSFTTSIIQHQPLEQSTTTSPTGSPASDTHTSARARTHTLTDRHTHTHTHTDTHTQRVKQRNEILAINKSAVGRAIYQEAAIRTDRRGGGNPSEVIC